MKLRIAILALAALACAEREAGFPGGTLVDLSHAFDAETIFWPTEQGFALERGFAGITERGYYYEANRFRSAEHGGTHIDAPIHFAEARLHVDQIPLEKLVGPGIAIDVSDACDRDPDHAIPTEAFVRWEEQHGELPEGALVLLHTGFARHWPNRAEYLGTAARGPEAVPELHFPGLAPEAARWLVERRAIAAIGIDTASIDPGQSVDFESHRILFADDIPAFENLTNLDALPAKGFGVIALPMKIRGGSGGPLRAVAVLPGPG